jgi:hypothetical protein
MTGKLPFFPFLSFLIVETDEISCEDISDFKE